MSPALRQTFAYFDRHRAERKNTSPNVCVPDVSAARAETEKLSTIACKTIIKKFDINAEAVVRAAHETLAEVVAL
jgi:hypothetical protein